jgi:hypothetical protein
MITSGLFTTFHMEAFYDFSLTDIVGGQVMFLVRTIMAYKHTLANVFLGEYINSRVEFVKLTHV